MQIFTALQVQCFFLYYVKLEIHKIWTILLTALNAYITFSECTQWAEFMQQSNTMWIYRVLISALIGDLSIRDLNGS